MARMLFKSFETILAMMGAIYISNPIIAIIWASHGYYGDPAQSFQPCGIALFISIAAIVGIWWDDIKQGENY